MTVPPSVKEIVTLTVSATSELTVTVDSCKTELVSASSVGAHPNNTKLNDKANNNFFIFLSTSNLYLIEAPSPTAGIMQKKSIRHRIDK